MKSACVPIIDIPRAWNAEGKEIMGRQDTSRVVNIRKGHPPERDIITSKKQSPLKAEIFSARLNEKIWSYPDLSPQIV